MGSVDTRVRLAGAGDADSVAELLDAFNREYDEPTPGVAVLSSRVQVLLGNDAMILVCGQPSVGVAVLRFREALWSASLECYLAELYVSPDSRGRGLGRALMEAALEIALERGAATMDLGTAEDDIVARTLYERMGFRNTDKPQGDSVNYFYEREL